MVLTIISRLNLLLMEIIVGISLNESGTNDPIIPLYNTPEHKYNLGLSGRDLHFKQNTNI